MRVRSLVILLPLMIACNNQVKTKDVTKDTAGQITQLPPIPAIPDTIFNGFGTEPFWFVHVIENSKIIFHPADGPDVEVPFVTATMPDSITRKYNSSNSTTTMELTIVKKDCSDGMSDEIHPYKVTLLLNAITYSGCGRKE